MPARNPKPYRRTAKYPRLIWCGHISMCCKTTHTCQSSSLPFSASSSQPCTLGNRCVLPTASPHPSRAIVYLLFWIISTQRIQKCKRLFQWNAMLWQCKANPNTKNKTETSVLWKAEHFLCNGLFFQRKLWSVHVPRPNYNFKFPTSNHFILRVTEHGKITLGFFWRRMCKTAQIKVGMCSVAS